MLPNMETIVISSCPLCRCSHTYQLAARARPLSPHNRALYETGKDMMKNSISTSRDFCKFMITLSTGAIPIYFGLLKFVLPEDLTFTLNQKLLLSLSPFVFLISELIFILGYFPKVDSLSLDIIEEIMKSYEQTLSERRKYTNVGIILFFFGNLLSILAVIFLIII